MLILLTLFVSILTQCIENSYLSIPQTIEKQESTGQITIRLEGEFIVGYGEDFKINDKSKIQVHQGDGETLVIFGPQNFEIFCPATHIIPDEEEAKCEIIVNLYQMNTTETEILEFASLVIPVEIDDDIRENPTLQMSTNFQLRLVDLAEQLKDVDYYIQYDNCAKKVFLLTDSLPITTEQIKILQTYSKSLELTAETVPLATLIKGKITVEDYTIDKRSNIHLFALITIILGVIILAGIRAFKKREEQKPNENDGMEIPMLK